MLSTLAAIHNGYYCPSEDPTKRVDISPPSQPSESFTIATLPPVSTASYDRTSVSVVKDDCLLTALNMKERGFRPVVLNMASVRKPQPHLLDGFIRAFGKNTDFIIPQS